MYFIMLKEIIYFNKYKKYKSKYLKLKTIYKTNSINYINENNSYEKILFNGINNLHKNLLKIDLNHDNSNVKNNKYFELINDIEVDLTKKEDNLFTNENMNKDILKSLILNGNIIDKSSKFINFYVNQNANSKFLKISELKNYHIIFDNKSNDNTTKLNLKKLFGIDKFIITFIGEVEKLIVTTNDKNSLSTIDSQFLENGKLKVEYKKLGVFLGLLSNLKQSINYNAYHEFPNQNHFNLFIQYCFETVTFFHKILKTELETSFLNTINDFLKNNDIKNYLNHYLKYNKEVNKKLKNNDKINSFKLLLDQLYQNISSNLSIKNIIEPLIKSIVYSIKLSRDTAYLEEMKHIISYQNLNLIFITCDVILAYRCILNNLSVILTIGKLIKFISINKGNKNYFIDNPFNYPSNNKVNYNLLKKIIENPSLEITNNLNLSQKYHLLNQQVNLLYNY